MPLRLEPLELTSQQRRNQVSSEGPAWTTNNHRDSPLRIPKTKAVKFSMAGNPNRPPDPDGPLVAAASSAHVSDMDSTGSDMKFFDYNFHSLKKAVSSVSDPSVALRPNSNGIKSL